MTYGTFLRTARERAGMSQGALAAAIDPALRVHQTRVSEWERGVSVPDRAQAARIHAALDLTESQRANADALLLAFEEERVLVKRGAA